MDKNNIIKILVITIMMMFVCYQSAYCAESGTARISIVKDGTLWNNINVSESYEECESLNSATSTLGTDKLEAHLTTDYDWSIMAIFSSSQYGRTTTNAPKTTSTTKNKSGIYDIGTNYIQTTSMINTSTSTSSTFFKRII